MVASRQGSGPTVRGDYTTDVFSFPKYINVPQAILPSAPTAHQKVNYYHKWQNTGKVRRIIPLGSNHIGLVVPEHRGRPKRPHLTATHGSRVRAHERPTHPVRQWQEQVCSHQHLQFLCSAAPGHQKPLSKTQPPRQRPRPENVDEGIGPSVVSTAPAPAAKRKRSRRDPDNKMQPPPSRNRRASRKVTSTSAAHEQPDAELPTQTPEPSRTVLLEVTDPAEVKKRKKKLKVPKGHKLIHFLRHATSWCKYTPVIASC